MNVHYEDKTVSWPFYLYNGNPHIWERRSLYWDGALLPPGPDRLSHKTADHQDRILCNLVPQEWDSRLTWNEKDVASIHDQCGLVTSVAIYMVGWADLPDSDRGDFTRRYVVDMSSYTSNGSWCMGIKGEMYGRVYVTFAWDMYIYELFIAFVCFVVCSLL